MYLLLFSVCHVKYPVFWKLEHEFLVLIYMLIIYYFHIIKIISIRPKAYSVLTVLTVNSNAILSSPVIFRFFQMISWRYPQVLQTLCIINHNQFTQCHSLYWLWQFLWKCLIVYFFCWFYYTRCAYIYQIKKDTKGISFPWYPYFIAFLNDQILSKTNYL